MVFQKGHISWHKGTHKGLKGGLTTLKRPVEERFWEKVNIRGPDECWEWQAGKIRKGYGRFGLTDGKLILAHRVAYVLAYGPIPDDILVCHHCDNPPCVNPKHLFLGTKRDNSQDAIKKGRWDPKNHRTRRGEECHQTELTEEAVIKIRLMLNAGATLRMVANKFGVDEHSVWCIKHKVSWKHVGITEGQVPNTLPPKIPRRNLTENEVREIKRLVGKEPQSGIARKFGVTRATIGYIERVAELWKPSIC